MVSRSSTYINDESNIRQIYYAQQTNRKCFGVTPTIYLMSEHAMHSQIPQILAGFGFDGAIMRSHYMMYGYNPTFDDPVGLWTGVDGTRIWTVPTYRGEGAEFGKTTVDDWILTRCPGPRMWRKFAGKIRDSICAYPSAHRHQSGRQKNLFPATIG